MLGLITVGIDDMESISVSFFPAESCILSDMLTNSIMGLTNGYSNKKNLF